MQPIERQSAVQQAAERIKEYIRSDERHIGDKLPAEHWFCEQLGISRSTLREAIRLLQADGYTEMKPGRGAFIASKTGRSRVDAAAWLSENKASLWDLLEVRMAIEELAIRLAVERAVPAEIDGLRHIHEEFLEAVRQDQVETIASLDADFHFAIARMTHNALLINISELLVANLTNFRQRTFQIPQNVQNSVEPHGQILKAFEMKNTEMGIAAIHQHFEKMFEDLEQSPVRYTEL